MNGWMDNSKAAAKVPLSRQRPHHTAGRQGTGVSTLMWSRLAEPTVFILVITITRTTAIIIRQYLLLPRQWDQCFTYTVSFRLDGDPVREVKFIFYSWRKTAQEADSTGVEPGFSCLQSSALKHVSTWISQMAAVCLLLPLRAGPSTDNRAAEWWPGARVWSLTKTVYSLCAPLVGCPFLHSGFLGNSSDSLLNTKHTLKKKFFFKFIRLR